MHAIIRFSFLALLISVALAPAAAEAKHASIIDDLLDGRLDRHSLLEAALLASGTQQRAQFARHRWSIDRCVALAKSKVQTNSTKHEIAEAALTAIHQEILVGQFVDHCNNVTTTLDRGDFNCVTASVIFQIIADRMGLDSSVELLPNHVRCQLAIQERGTLSSFTVETTQAAGVHDTSQQAIGRIISQAQLVGKLYYNRALDLLNERKFDESLRYAELAWRLDPIHLEARENISIVRSHWAIAEAQAADWNTAIALLRGGRGSWSETELADSTIATAKVFVFRAWLEATQRDQSQSSQRMREQLLLSIAEHPTNSRLLQLLQAMPNI